MLVDGTVKEGRTLVEMAGVGVTGGRVGSGDRVGVMMGDRVRCGHGVGVIVPRGPKGLGVRVG